MAQCPAYVPANTPIPVCHLTCTTETTHPQEMPTCVQPDSGSVLGIGLVLAILLVLATTASVQIYRAVRRSRSKAYPTTGEEVLCP